MERELAGVAKMTGGELAGVTKMIGEELSTVAKRWERNWPEWLK